jgi:hypothetical protein
VATVLRSPEVYKQTGDPVPQPLAPGPRRFADIVDELRAQAGPAPVWRSPADLYAAVLETQADQHAAEPSPDPRTSRLVFPRHRALAAWNLITAKRRWPDELDGDAAARVAFAKVADIPISELTFADRERFLATYELALAPKR